MTNQAIAVKPMYLIYGKEQPLLGEVGGKGHSLIKMAGSGLPVPPGFVLTTEFFKSWFDHIKKQKEWDDFLKSTPDKLSLHCQALKKLCTDLNFDDTQKLLIEESLRETGLSGEGTFFAVRSSSPEEDLEGASFAGGYETVLGVTPSRIEEAVRRSFASCLDERVFLYKKEHGFTIDDARIAIIVQQQIASEISGVGFSLNPITNCYDEAVINANWGLGETVVAGIASPDQFIVDKVDKRIIEKKVGKKETSIWLSSDGGTSEKPDERHDQLTLKDSQIVELTSILIKIEEIYEKPMDIEWAYKDGKLFMLQARPITTWIPLPEGIITAPGEPRHLYIDGTLCVQGLHEPTSVMGTEFFTGFVSGILKEAFGVDIWNSLIKQKGMARGGRVYSDVSYVLLMQKKEKLASFFSNLDTVAAETIRNIDEDKYRAKSSPDAIKGLGFKAFTHMPDTIARVMEAAILPEQLNRYYKKSTERYLLKVKADNEKNLTVKEFYEVIMKTFAHYAIHTSLPTLIASIIAKGKIRELFKDNTQEIREQVEHLDRSLPGNLTVEMGLTLYHLCEFLPDEYGISLEVLLKGIQDRSIPGEFLHAWDEYLRLYGFRGPKEIDMAAPRFYDDPAVLLQQIISMRSLKDTDQNPVAYYERSQNERHNAYQILSKEIHKAGWEKSSEFEILYRIIQTFGGYRENHKYYLIMILDMLRKRVLNEAAKLKDGGRLDSADQVFDLTIEDLDEGIRTPSMDLRQRAAERTTYTNRIKHIKDFPHVIDSRGTILRPPRQSVKEGELQGDAISAGKVRGSVKVLHTADEKPLLPGEILVARATDPGWTPLFINAAAIVLEVGGMLQHGALVAREYGKPCVAGIENVTTLLHDGEIVEVDGSSGILRII
ncbi:MAG: PEP/pyruvate-binding domain-containing protein [Vulcanimicrobiota bacterium]